MQFSIENLFSVKGKVAIVTGGSRGIGYMIARAYVENGMKVYISSRKESACREVEAELSQIGECLAIAADLSTEDGRKNLVDFVREKEENIDVLVNNAGAVWAAPFGQFPEIGYDKIMNINVKALFMLSQDFLPMLQGTTNDPARIINIGSIDGIRVPSVENFSYSASKSAVHQLTRHLAVHLGRKGIAVNAIAPGLFRSKMTEGLLDTFQQQIERSCPMKRIGAEEDMAGMALYLASPASTYLNGAIIPLDGGLHLVNV